MLRIDLNSGGSYRARRISSGFCLTVTRKGSSYMLVSRGVTLRGTCLVCGSKPRGVRINIYLLFLVICKFLSEIVLSVSGPLFVYLFDFFR